MKLYDGLSSGMIVSDLLESLNVTFAVWNLCYTHLKVKVSHVHLKGGIISKTVPDRDVVITGH